MEMKGNMSEIEREIKADRRSIQKCFGNRFGRTKIKLLLNAVQKVRKAASMAEAEAGKDYDSVQDPRIVKSIDDVITALDNARRRFDNYMTAAANEIAERTETEIQDKSDPNSTVLALNNYQPTSAVCIEAKEAVVNWHPYYWYWYHRNNWSIYHRLYYYWFCAWYIRIVIRLRVWWWWIWRPWGWPYFWPWRWCQYWWPWGWWWGWGWGWWRWFSWG